MAPEGAAILQLGTTDAKELIGRMPLKQNRFDRKRPILAFGKTAEGQMVTDVPRGLFSYM